MTQLGMTFDPTQVAPAQGSTPQLPISDPKGHPVIITTSELAPTKDNSGTMLVLDLEVVDGPCKGATGKYRLNIGNSNAQAVQIAYGQLSAICHAIGHLQPLNDVAVLHGRVFRAVVKLQDGAEGKEKGYTQVSHVLDINGNKPGHASVALQAQQPAFGQQPQFPVVSNVPMQQQPSQQGFAPPPAAPQQFNQPNFPAPGQAGNPAAAPWAQR